MGVVIWDLVWPEESKVSKFYLDSLFHLHVVHLWVCHLPTRLTALSERRGGWKRLLSLTTHSVGFRFICATHRNIAVGHTVRLFLFIARKWTVFESHGAKDSSQHRSD